MPGAGRSVAGINDRQVSNLNASRLLIVEDDPGLLSQLRWPLSDFAVATAADRRGALDQLRRHQPAVVLQDLGLPPDPHGTSEGMATLRAILEAAPHTRVIVVTGNGDDASAVRAIGLGACDFYQKPVTIETLKWIVERAFHVADLEARNRSLLADQNMLLPGVIGASDLMRRACRLVEKVAATSASVLLLGETGTGKECFARAVHQLSDRRNRPFVAINCAAIPEALLEGELFGHEKGAYTGAHRQRAGRLEGAAGGTLFLDEIGDMPLALQVKLLRFLQERVIERVGGHQSIPVDVRVIAATHRDLVALMRAADFREDLYYRLSEVTIPIPPLRERTGDVELLARFLLARAAERHGRMITGFSDDALAMIRESPWPGNVRELENAISRAVILAEGRLINTTALAYGEYATGSLNLRRVRDDAERAALDRAFAHAGGNVVHAARLLGISRSACYELMHKHGYR